jgi:hypothetical protein
MLQITAGSLVLKPSAGAASAVVVVEARRED